MRPEVMEAKIPVDFRLPNFSKIDEAFEFYRDTYLLILGMSKPVLSSLRKQFSKLVK